MFLEEVKEIYFFLFTSFQQTFLDKEIRYKIKICVYVWLQNWHCWLSFLIHHNRREIKHNNFFYLNTFLKDESYIGHVHILGNLSLTMPFYLLSIYIRNVSIFGLYMNSFKSYDILRIFHINILDFLLIPLVSEATQAHFINMPQTTCKSHYQYPQ